MKRILTSLILTLLWLGATAQVNVHIVGTSANGAGKRIELYSYTDMLTLDEQLEDACVIDSNGAFALACYANYPRLVVLQVESYNQSFYIEPGRRYEVYIPEFDWTIDEQRNVFLMPEPLPVQFLNLPPAELNLGIGAFEHLVDSFVVANRIHFDPRFRPNRRYFDSLQIAVGPTDDDFLGRYKEYTLATMQYDMRFASRKRLVAKYIADQPIRYYDEQYMRLFLTLFRESISMGTQWLPLGQLVEWVDRGDLASYLDSVGLDPLLRNEQVRELAVLEALKESYYDAVYDRQGVRQMVAQLAEQTKFADHRTLARNLLRKFDRQDSSSNELGQVCLPDAERRTVCLDSLLGKWLYIAFVRVGDPNSLAELETMAFFRDSVYAHHHDVQFVGVSCDREFQKMYHMLKNSRRGHRYDWLWLHFDYDYRLLERFDVVSYPTFVLIDPEGRRPYDITPAPATGFLLNAPWDKKEQPVDNQSEFDFNR